jgi:hypothetical protein
LIVLRSGSFWNPFPIFRLDRQQAQAINTGGWRLVTIAGSAARTGDLRAAPCEQLDAACLEHEAGYIAGRSQLVCNRDVIERLDRCRSLDAIYNPVKGEKLKLCDSPEDGFIIAHLL